MNIKEINGRKILSQDSIDRYSNNITALADNGGSGNAFIFTTTPQLTGSFPKMLILTFSEVSGHVPTGASTITVDSVGTVDLTRQDGTPLRSGDVVGGKRYIAIFENSRYSLVGVGITDGVGDITPQNNPIVDNDNINTFASKTQGQIDSLAYTKADRPNGVTAGGEIETGIDYITVGATQWMIGFVNYSAPIITFSNITLSTSGNQRYIAIYGDTNNEINKLEGSESTLAVYPDLPPNTILIGYILVGDGVISSPAPDLSAYATTNWVFNWAEPKILRSTRTTNFRLDYPLYPSQIIRNGGTVDIAVQTYYTGCKINGQINKSIVVKPNQFAVIKGVQNNDDNYLVFVVDEVPSVYDTEIASINNELQNRYTKTEADSTYVTLSTNQTVTGAKKFTKKIKVDGDVNLGYSEVPKLNLTQKYLTFDGEILPTPPDIRTLMLVSTGGKAYFLYQNKILENYSLVGSPSTLVNNFRSRTTFDNADEEIIGTIIDIQFTNDDTCYIVVDSAGVFTVYKSESYSSMPTFTVVTGYNIVSGTPALVGNLRIAAKDNVLVVAGEGPGGECFISRSANKGSTFTVSLGNSNINWPNRPFYLKLTILDNNNIVVVRYISYYGIYGNTYFKANVFTYSTTLAELARWEEPSNGYDLDENGGVPTYNQNIPVISFYTSENDYFINLGDSKKYKNGLRVLQQIPDFENVAKVEAGKYFKIVEDVIYLSDKVSFDYQKVHTNFEGLPLHVVFTNNSIYIFKEASIEIISDLVSVGNYTVGMAAINDVDDITTFKVADPKSDLDAVNLQTLENYVAGNVPTIQDATIATKGIAQLDTDANIQSNTNSSRVVTSGNLTAWWIWVKTQVQTFAQKITFTLAPRFSSTIASTWLVVDANKDLASAPYTPANKAGETFTGAVILAADATANLGAATKQQTEAFANSLITALRAGVSTEGDNLLKLYNLIVASQSEVTVATTAARNAYNVTKLPTSIFVLDDGDGKWSLYKCTTLGINRDANDIKISDPDLLNAVMTGSQIKSAYQSQPSSFTDALYTALITNANMGNGYLLLNGSGQIPALSGVNLTNLDSANVSNLSPTRRWWTDALATTLASKADAENYYSKTEIDTNQEKIHGYVTYGGNLATIFNTPYKVTYALTADCVFQGEGRKVNGVMNGSLAAKAGQFVTVARAADDLTNSYVWAVDSVPNYIDILSDKIAKYADNSHAGNNFVIAGFTDLPYMFLISFSTQYAGYRPTGASTLTIAGQTLPLNRQDGTPLQSGDVGGGLYVCLRNFYPDSYRLVGVGITGTEVDDILEFANLASFPATGETGKIYVALDTNLTYRWSGSAYVQVGGGAIPTTIGTRFIINKTASWSITQTDVNNTIAGGYSGITYVYNSTTAGNFTVPALTVPIGFTIRVHVIGTGMVTVVPSSTTINSRDNLLKSVAQHSAFELEYIMTDVYQLAGDLV